MSHGQRSALERSATHTLAAHATLDTLSDRPQEGAEPEAALVEAAKAGDQRALTQLVAACLPRIAALARRYAVAPHVERLELVQEGVAGLLQALQRYDPARGTPFWSYARPTVQRAMQRLVGELGDAVTLSDHALRRLSQLRHAEDELIRKRRRLPLRREIVEHSGINRDEAERLLAAARPRRSFQEPITADDGDVIGSLGDFIDDPRAEDAYERVLDAMEAHELLPLLSELSDRELRVMRARADGQSVSEIAEQLGVSERRARDIERRARNKLRRTASE